MDPYIMPSCTIFFKDDSFTARWINTGLNSGLDKWFYSVSVQKPATKPDGNCL